MEVKSQRSKILLFLYVHQHGRHDVTCKPSFSDVLHVNLSHVLYYIIPRDALQGHRRGKNPVAYVFIFIPRDAPVGHRRGNNPVEYVFLFLFIFIFVTRSHKKQCRILIEV